MLETIKRIIGRGDCGECHQCYACHDAWLDAINASIDRNREDHNTDWVKTLERWRREGKASFADSVEAGQVRGKPTA